MRSVHSRIDIDLVPPNPVAEMFLQADTAAIGNEQALSANRAPGKWYLAGRFAHFPHHHDIGFSRYDGAARMPEYGLTGQVATFFSWSFRLGIIIGNHSFAITQRQETNKYRMVACSWQISLASAPCAGSDE